MYRLLRKSNYEEYNGGVLLPFRRTGLFVAEAEAESGAAQAADDMRELGDVVVNEDAAEDLVADIEEADQEHREGQPGVL